VGLLENSAAIDSHAEALGAAVVPFHEYLELVRVEDRSARAHSRLRPQQLDPVASDR
jgi:hypothetical protein